MVSEFGNRGFRRGRGLRQKSNHESNESYESRRSNRRKQRQQRVPSSDLDLDLPQSPLRYLCCLRFIFSDSCDSFDSWFLCLPLLDPRSPRHPRLLFFRFLTWLLPAGPPALSRVRTYDDFQENRASRDFLWNILPLAVFNR